jgi:hypothetical protein
MSEKGILLMIRSRVFMRINVELDPHFLGLQLETFFSIGQWLIGVIL